MAHQKHIRQGFKDNGHWLIRVAENGTYNLKLRRWPKESGLALNAEAPIRPAIPGTSVNKSKKGKAFTVNQASIKVQDIEQTKEVDPGAEFVEFTLELEKGETSIKTWFVLDNEEEIGAYYVDVEKL